MRLPRVMWLVRSARRCEIALFVTDRDTDRDGRLGTSKRVHEAMQI